MAIKVTKRAEADLGKFAGVPVRVEHDNGKTTINIGFAAVSTSEVREFVTKVNEVLAAINESTIAVG